MEVIKCICNRTADDHDGLERARQEEILEARFSLEDPGSLQEDGSLDRDLEIITDSETPSDTRGPSKDPLHRTSSQG